MLNVYIVQIQPDGTQQPEPALPAPGPARGRPLDTSLLRLWGRRHLDGHLLRPNIRHCQQQCTCLQVRVILYFDITGVSYFLG